MIVRYIDPADWTADDQLRADVKLRADQALREKRQRAGAVSPAMVACKRAQRAWKQKAAA